MRYQELKRIRHRLYQYIQYKTLTGKAVRAVADPYPQNNRCHQEDQYNCQPQEIQMGQRPFNDPSPDHTSTYTKQVAAGPKKAQKYQASVDSCVASEQVRVNQVW